MASEGITIWWCDTHEIGQTYDGEPWWDDEWTPYTCAFKTEYPVEGDCVPVQRVLVKPEGVADGVDE